MTWSSAEDIASWACGGLAWPCSQMMGRGVLGQRGGTGSGRTRQGRQHVARVHLLGEALCVDVRAQRLPDHLHVAADSDGPVVPGGHPAGQLATDHIDGRLPLLRPERRQVHTVLHRGVIVQMYPIGFCSGPDSTRDRGSAPVPRRGSGIELATHPDRGEVGRRDAERASRELALLKGAPSRTASGPPRSGHRPAVDRTWFWMTRVACCRWGGCTVEER